MGYECVGVNGFAGDRTPEAMLECHRFTKSFASHFDLSFELVGQPEGARELPWQAALTESKLTFETARMHLERILDAGSKPILITPRCATAIASLPIIVARHSGVVVLYFDAHGDLNMPETSESGYLGGMPITAALGEWDSGYGAGLETSNLIHIGGRDLDAAEQVFIDRTNLLTISKSQIEKDLSCLTKAILGKPVYIHLDTDVYDPSEVTAEYAVSDGLYRRHVAKIVDLVTQHGNLVGMEITELSPSNAKQREISYAALFESFDSINSN